MGRAAVALLLLLGPTRPSTGPRYFELRASFVPATRAGTPSTLSVTFEPKESDVEVNETPAPRLRLDPEQRVLLDKQPTPDESRRAVDLANPRYLDTALPVTFPVALVPGAPKGRHDLKATVIYFYCSRRERWCRKGESDIDFSVTVP
jgi:hypothetical protein